MLQHSRNGVKLAIGLKDVEGITIDQFMKLMCHLKYLSKTDDVNVLNEETEWINHAWNILSHRESGVL